MGCYRGTSPPKSIYACFYSTPQHCIKTCSCKTHLSFNAKKHPSLNTLVHQSVTFNLVQEIGNVNILCSFSVKKNSFCSFCQWKNLDLIHISEGFLLVWLMNCWYSRWVWKKTPSDSEGLNSKPGLHWHFRWLIDCWSPLWIVSLVINGNKSDTSPNITKDACRVHCRKLLKKKKVFLQEFFPLSQSFIFISDFWLFFVHWLSTDLANWCENICFVVAAFQRTHAPFLTLSTLQGVSIYQC